MEIVNKTTVAANANASNRIKLIIMLLIRRDCNVRPITMPKAAPNRHWWKKWQAKNIRDIEISINIAT